MKSKKPLNIEEKEKKFKEYAVKNFKRSYSKDVVYSLWIEAANKCGNPKCNKEIFSFTKEAGELTTNRNSTTEIAHIVSLKSTEVRPPFKEYAYEHMKNQKTDNKFKDFEIYSKEALNSYNNLIILCSKCHKEFDNPKNDSNSNHFKSAQELHSFKRRELTTIRLEPFTLRIVSEKEFEALDIVLGAVEKAEIENYEININFDPVKNYKSIVEMRKNSATLINSLNEIVRGTGEWKVKIVNFLSNIKSNSNLFKKDEIEMIIEFSCDSNIKLATLSIAFGTISAISAESQKSREEMLNAAKKGKIAFEWVINSANKVQLAGKKEGNLLTSLLRKQYIASLESNERNFESFSLAYMARWGTGKTSMMRYVKNELKETYRFVEINLWHIANSISNNNSAEDNLFVRSIVREALTQMTGDEEIVKTFLDSAKTKNIDNNNVELVNAALAKAINIPGKSDDIKVFAERSKFVDQFISSLSNFVKTLYSQTLKPVVFIFDDLDRITDDEQIYSILDALVAFLNMKNSVFIIPVDEAKVVKAILKKDPNIDPYTYMNKYFTYSIKVPFIPAMESKTIVTKTINDFFGTGSEKISENIKELMSQVIEPTYRNVKDFLNTYLTNKYLFQDHKFRMKERFDELNDEAVLFASAMQQKFPLFTDYMSGDIARNNVLVKTNESVNSIFNYIKEGKSINDLAPEELNKWFKDEEFWSSIFGFELMPENTKSLEDFLKYVTEDGENDKKLSKIKTLKVVSNLKKLNKVFNTDVKSGEFWIAFWGAVTQAEIKNSSAIEFAGVSSTISIFKDLNNDQIGETLEKENIEKNALEVITEKLTEFEKDGFIEYPETIMKKIVENMNSINKNITKEEDKNE